MLCIVQSNPFDDPCPSLLKIVSIQTWNVDGTWNVDETWMSGG